MKLEIEMGVCKTCKHYRSYEYDPSPPGVALSSGTMIDDYCNLMETGIDENIPDNPEVGINEDNQCPCWEPPINFCNEHNCWYEYQCSKCEEMMYQQMEEFYNG